MDGHHVQGQVWAAAHVNADATVQFVRGCTVADGGVGIYTITLDKEIDAAECVLIATPRQGVDHTAVVVDTSDAVKTVRTYDGAAGAAADTEFSFVCIRCVR